MVLPLDDPHGKKLNTADFLRGGRGEVIVQLNTDQSQLLREISNLPFIPYHVKGYISKRLRHQKNLQSKKKYNTVVTLMGSSL